MSARRPKAPHSKIQKNQYLQVFVRCRPLSENEVRQKNTSVVDISNRKDISIQDKINSTVTKTYAFDKVFGPSSAQAEVFQTVVEPLISDVLNGFNCTVFAYGQTGSGKTFTMEGDLDSTSAQVFSQDSKAGLIPRAVCTLFDELRVLQSEYTVRISLMELYNEELYDLFSPDDVPPKLRLFEDSTKKGSVLVYGLQEVMVHTQSQVLNELRKGSAKRQVAATMLNAQSSRSHTIFSVTVHFKENSVDGEELLRTGKLNLVDLAGSENIGRSGSVDKRAREAASINQSLLTLSRVTSCLVEHQCHVPYRESKLTRLLQDSLGGKTKTSLIATISPAHSNAEETMSTLDYANRAKSVANKPEVNQKLSQNVVMKEYMDVIEDLKKKLELHRNGTGIYINDENYRQIIDQTKERNSQICEILEKIKYTLALKKSTEEVYHTISTSIENQKLNVENIKKTVSVMEEEIAASTEVLKKAVIEQDEAKSVRGSVVHKENELHAQAEQLTDVVDSARKDNEKMHDRLDHSRVVLSGNGVVLKQLVGQANFVLHSSKKMLTSLSEGVQTLEKLLSAMETLDIGTRRDSAIVAEEIQKYFADLKLQIDQYKAALYVVEEQRKAVISEEKHNLEAAYQNLVKVHENSERMLQNASEQYHRFISQLSLEGIMKSEFVTHFTQNMKKSIHSNLNDVLNKVDSVQTESGKRIQNIVIALNGLQQVQNKPLDFMGANVKSVVETVLAIDTLCNGARKELKDNQMQLLNCHKEKNEEISSIKEKMANEAEHFQAQCSEISTGSNTPIDVFRNGREHLVCELKDFSQSYTVTVQENDVACNRTAEAVTKELLNIDSIKSSFMLKKLKDINYQCAAKLTSEVCSMKNFLKTSEQFGQTLSSKVEEIKLKKDQYEELEDEYLGMFLDGVQSASSDVIEHLESGKSVVSEIVVHKISQDISTGQTPVRKCYGPIPKLASMDSPTVSKARQRIVNAPWKQLLRSPRKPLKSTMSLQDLEDDNGIVSDSEMSIVNKKISQFCGLQKASSLSDLRTKDVFHRPRIPKKYARKVL